jgi:F-type H+-transporting ATPase subunit epsilon
MAKLRLRIVTPDEIKLDEDVSMVIMRCVTGDMGILPGHEPCSAILDFGAMRIINDGEEHRIAVFGGIAQVRDNTVTILANGAQWPEDIDAAEAEAEREAAQSRITNASDTLAIQRDHVMLRRTLVQIEVSAYPLISSKRAAPEPTPGKE